MAIDSQSSQALAALALHRFGFGPRPGDIAAIASDSRGAVLAEIRTGGGKIDNTGLPASGEAFRAATAFRKERKAERAAAKGESDRGAMEATEDQAAPMPRAGPPLPQKIYLDEARARYDAALNSKIGFAERWVWFWSNHFCVSADKGNVRPLCGAYEREAIRPHAFGRFSDMLLAVETHPAMLIYLDNARSIGPDSMAGLRRGKGLNENLAREILELHTLGVRSGYTQADVTNFAKAITGWSLVPPRLDPVRGGEFMFNQRIHEPGPQHIIGKTFPDGGFEQGRAVLDTVAQSPLTASHVCAKLARHFVADDPPPALVERLKRRFLDTHGDLKELAKTLVTAPEAWVTPATKLKRPGEWIMAALRINGLPVKDVRKVVGAQSLLGEPLWRPPAPKGFSDTSADWLDGLAQRLDIANQMGRVIGNNGLEPDAMVDTALGPLASRETRETVKRAASRPQATALLLMAPEFQKR